MKSYYLIDTSGFVYGAMGFVDRLVVGAAVMMIQNFCPTIPKNPLQPITYFQWVLAIFNGGFICAALILVATLLLIGRKSYGAQGLQ